MPYEGDIKMKKIFMLTMLITFLSAGCLAEQNDPWDNALNIDETHVILSDEEKKTFFSHLRRYDFAR